MEARASAPARRRAPSRPSLRVLDRSSAPGRSPAAVVGGLFVVLLFVALFGVVAFQAFLVQTQGKLDDANRRVATEEQRGKELRKQAAELGSPERVLAAAKDRLGMIPPGDVRYLQPKADDDAKATFDPVRDKAPTPSTTAPATASTSKATTPTTKATTPTTKPATRTTTPTTVKQATR